MASKPSATSATLEHLDLDLVDVMIETGDDGVVAIGNPMSAGFTPARPLFTVLVGYETFHRPVCEMFEGTFVTPGQAAGHLAGADFERVVFDSPSRIIDVGERRRS